MNMLYSDYYNVLGSDTATYVKMSKAWFEDPDVSEGKAYRYVLFFIDILKYCGIISI